MASARDKFERFHRKNPEVYDLFVTFARRAHRAGWKRVSIRLLSNRVRWEVAMRTAGDRYKINNNHLSFYSRLIEENCPDLRGFITKRASRADGPRQAELWG